MKIAVTMSLKAGYLLNLTLLVLSQAIVPVEYIFMVQRVEIGMDLDLKIVKSFGITVLYGESLDATCETEKCTNSRVF